KKRKQKTGADARFSLTTRRICATPAPPTSTLNWPRKCFTGWIATRPAKMPSRSGFCLSRRCDSPSVAPCRSSRQLTRGATGFFKEGEAMTVKMFNGQDQKFIDACQKADVKPTARQYRKWLRGIGSAFKVRKAG